MDDVLKTGGFHPVCIYIEYYQLYTVKGKSSPRALGGDGGTGGFGCNVIANLIRFY